MAPRISLALALHDHQPVGNFGWVIAENYERAYEPMLRALERHPGVRVALHVTGPLLDWIGSERPAFLDRLRALVARGQVEVMGGGWAEPVLVALPDRDRVGQLRRMADEVERLVGVRPAGAWLAERVWEPDLPVAIAGAGYQWTILDDAHFRAASVPEDALWGAYVTEDQGALLTVFGTEQGLRYRIPFGEVDDVIAHLQRHATEDGTRLGVMGDDGEKFGAWPETYAHCWGKTRWVDRFFAALEANADWLVTVTPSMWLADHPPIGRVYLPSGSYAEMGEWALPADEARTFQRLVRAAVAENRPEARFLRGGTWRNFAAKYRELGDLRAQMLRASAAVAALEAPPGATVGPPERGAAHDVTLPALALDHLYRGQANDAYWHGLFGGVYLPDLRLAVAHHLIAAEDLADIGARDIGARQAPPSQGPGSQGPASPTRLATGQVDLDLDGIDEVRLVGPGQVVIIDPAEGGGIGTWDIRPVRHAVASVMRRRPEAYHGTLLEEEARLAAAAQPPRPTPVGGPTQSAAPSIHDIVMAKESGLGERLHYDAWERRSGLVHLYAPDATPESVATARAHTLARPDGHCRVVALTDERVELVREVVDATGLDARIATAITIGGTRSTPTLRLDLGVQNRGTSAIDTRLGVSWDLMLLGGGGNPAAYHEIGGERLPHDGAGTAEGVTAFAAGNDQVGLRIESRVEPPADAWWASIDTVSNSESGFERIHQGSGMMLSWPVTIPARGHLTASVEHVVSTERDDSAREGFTA
jgi:4-alpha-glucanotransferase